MTIRTRLTVWYSSILLVGLGLVAGWTYYEMVAEHPGVKRELDAEGQSPLEEVGEVLLYGGVPALVLAWVGGWFLMRRALAPVSRLTQTMDHLNTGNLHQQLPRSGNGDELDRLTEVFNGMMRRLDNSFQRIREFTLHASHELKTPLSLMRNELDTAMREETLLPQERQRTTSLLQEIERLTHIVDTLMFLTKADTGLLVLQKAPLRLDVLVQEACADAEVLGHPERIRCHVQDCEPLTVSADRRRLRQALLILTDNAVKYNRPDGRVTLGLRRENDNAVLTVTNTGPGIPPETLSRVFDNFFRGDASHNRDVEGCGLGLTIAQRIIQAHNGQIRIESEVNRETTVSVILPAIASVTEPEVAVIDQQPIAPAVAPAPALSSPRAADPVTSVARGVQVTPK